MRCNVGKTDQMLRIAAGVLIIGAGAYFQSGWGAIGIIPFLTGLFRWCPVYVPFGIKTRQTE